MAVKVVGARMVIAAVVLLLEISMAIPVLAQSTPVPGACKKANSAADLACPTSEKYDYTCQSGQPDKAHPDETCAKGMLCKQVTDGSTIQGSCCGPLSCNMTQAPASTPTPTKVTCPGSSPSTVSIAGFNFTIGSVLQALVADAFFAQADPCPSSDNSPTVTPAKPISAQPAAPTSAPATPAAPSAPSASAAPAAPSAAPAPSVSSAAPSEPSAPSAPATTPNEPSFTGNPTLSNVGTQPVSATNPLAPASQGSGSSPSGTYTPIQPTFGSGGGSTYVPPIAANSPLTSFVSSMGNLNLNSIFGFFNSLLAPASHVPTQVPHISQTPQIIVESNPILVTFGEVSPQFSQNNVSRPTITQTPIQQPYQSLLNLLLGGQPQTSPVQIANLVQIGGNTGTPTPTLTPANVLGIQQISQEIPQEASSLSSSSSLDSQLPDTNSLAQNAVNSLENYQNIPEQFYIEEASLAQAQSDYQWLQAQIAAWENAKDAGVCDSTCDNALSLLESEASPQYRQVQMLQAVVNAGPEALEATSSTATSTTSATSQVAEVTTQVPGADQMTVVANQSSTLQTPVPAEGAPFYTEQNNQWCDQYDQCIPQGSFATSPASSTVRAMQELATTSTLEAQNSAAEDPVTAIVQTVTGWWSDVVSLFTPNTAATAGQVQTCSLFKSFFGGCKGY